MFDDPKPAQSHLLIKIRLSILALIALAAYYFAWRWVRPDNPNLPLSFAAGINLWPAALIALLVGGLVTPIAYFVSGGDGRHVAFLAVPFGVSLWGLLGGTPESLFVRFASSAGRDGIYPRFLLDAIVWYGVVISGLLITGYLVRGKADSSPLDRPNQPAAPVAARTDWKKWLIASGLTAILSVVLLFILGKSRGENFIQLNHSFRPYARVIDMGQAVFAVIAAFWLATLAIHQLYKFPLKYFVAAPILTAFIIYLYGLLRPGDFSGGCVAALIAPQAVVTTILPVILVGFSLPAIAWGYSQSLQMVAAREKME